MKEVQKTDDRFNTLFYFFFFCFRNVDCSTQFFILLQPQDWMAFKYVIFGQLVIGDDTLKKIEKVPIWYESPKADILISKASILNLKCHDIKVNKGIHKYLDGHTEDLIAIGELFYEVSRRFWYKLAYVRIYRQYYYDRIVFF